MSTVPNNILQTVTTFNDNNLAYLQNLNCFISSFNTDYQNFQDLPANLGDNVNIALPPKTTVTASLIANFQGQAQRVQNLACTQAANSSFAYTAQQNIFNLETYWEKFAKSAAVYIGAQIERNVALNCVSKVPVMTVIDGDSVPTGAFYTNSGPYRFYGDGVTPLNSFQQLAKANVNFRNYGAAPGPANFYLTDTCIPDIIGTGANQFVPMRNEELTDSWDLGRYKGSNNRYMTSNLLPLFDAGVVGNDGLTLTVVSTDDPTGANIQNITFSSTTATESDAIRISDSLQFQDGVSGQENVRFLVFTAFVPSQQPVQIRALQNASLSGSQVTVNIFPALTSTPGPNQNISRNIVAGMQVKVLPSHRAGIVIGGNAGYLAMPRLPNEDPFSTSAKTDDQTKVSLRTYYGSQFGKNSKGIVTDAIWGTTVIPEYCMKLVFPVNQ